MSLIGFTRRLVCRRTLKWFCLLLLLVVCGGVGYGYWLWVHTDEILVQMILKKQAEMAPDWEMTIDRAHFDWNRRIRLYNVTIKAKGQHAPVLMLPEIVVAIDHEQFKNRQKILIDSIKLVRPQFDLVRDVHGVWNWQALLLPPKNDKHETPLAEWVIENGTIRVALEQSLQADGTRADPGKLVIDKAMAQLVPAGKKSYVISGNGEVNQAGKVNIKGALDFARHTWSIDGTMQQLEFNGDLLNLVAGTSAELRQKLAKLDDSLIRAHTQLAGLPADSRNKPFAVASRPQRIPALNTGQTQPQAGPPNSSPYPRQPPVILVPEPPPFDEVHRVPYPGMTGPRPSAIIPGQPTAPGTGGVVATSTEPITVPDFGLACICDVSFRVGRKEQGAELDFGMQIDASQGTLTNPVLPFALRGLAGQVFWDNHQIEFRNLTAKNGRTRLQLNGRVERQGETTPSRLLLRLDELPLDDRLRSRLPLSLRGAYDALNAEGLLSAQVELSHDGDGQWQGKNLVASVSQGVIRAEKFPYPLTDVTGIIRQQNQDLLIELDGLAGGQPVAIRGGVRQPGVSTETWLTITADRFPLDRRFVNACPPAGQRTLGELHLTGWAAGTVRMYRPPGDRQPFTVDIDAQLFHCQAEPNCFPYRLSNIAGHVTFRTTEDRWIFKGFHGEHDAGVVRLNGDFGPVFPRGRDGEIIPNGEVTKALRLNLAGRDLPLDESLQRALPPRLFQLWNDFQPTGKIAGFEAKLAWSPGAPPVVEVPRLTIRDGGLLMKAWPYPLTDVAAEFNYRGDRADVVSLSGMHDETKIRTKGFVQFTPGQPWQVRLTEIFLDDLLPNRSFRMSLPAALQNVLNQLDPQKSLSLSGMADIRGTDDPRVPITAGWDVEFVFTGNTFDVGILLEQVYGRVGYRGTWDGRQINSVGAFDLSSASVWGYQFTNIRGPLQIVGTQLVVGSLDALDPNRRSGEQTPRPVPIEERLTAQAIGGTVVLDAEAALGENPGWRLKAFLQKASLEEYARRYLPGVRNLRGVVNAWVSVASRDADNGKINGEGQVRISPAALYELPVITQVLQALVFNPPDRTAFKYAFLDFGIANEEFRFKEIDLVGDSLTLRGQGTMKFDGRLNLDFYSRMPRNGLLRLPVPVVGNLVGGALDRVTEDWVRVEVRGRTNLPQAKLVAAPVLNDAVRRFLEAFGDSPETLRKTAVPFWDAFNPNAARPTPPAAGQIP